MTNPWIDCSVLHEPNETNLGDRDRLQLVRLGRALKENRSQQKQRQETFIHEQGNARPHVARPAKIFSRYACSQQKQNLK